MLTPSALSAWHCADTGGAEMKGTDMAPVLLKPDCE